MKLYSQKDPAWKNNRLGTCSDTIGQSGCNITSMGMLAGISPDKVNERVPYVNGCLLSDYTSSKALGLAFEGVTKKAPSHICKAETDHWRSVGVPQHFFIWRPDGMIADPLDYPVIWKKNQYNIVSYRLIKPLEGEEVMEKEFVDAVEAVTGKEYGDKLNDNEQKDAAKRIMKHIDDEAGRLLDDIERIEGLKKEIEELSKRPESCPVCDSTEPVPVQYFEVKVQAEELPAGELFRLTLKKIFQQVKSWIEK